MTLKIEEVHEAGDHAVSGGGTVDPLGLARTVAEEYRAMEDGHHAQLRAFLGQGLSGLSLVSASPQVHMRS